jgi:hypothetical protein
MRRVRSRASPAIFVAWTKPHVSEIKAAAAPTHFRIAAIGEGFGSLGETSRGRERWLDLAGMGAFLKAGL